MLFICAPNPNHINDALKEIVGTDKIKTTKGIKCIVHAQWMQCRCLQILDPNAQWQCNYTHILSQIFQWHKTRVQQINYRAFLWSSFQCAFFYCFCWYCCCCITFSCFCYFSYAFWTIFDKTRSYVAPPSSLFFFINKNE